MLIKAKGNASLIKKLQGLHPPKLLILVGEHEDTEPTRALVETMFRGKPLHEHFNPNDVLFVEAPKIHRPAEFFGRFYKFAQTGSEKLAKGQVLLPEAKHSKTVQRRLGGLLREYLSSSIDSDFMQFVVDKHLNNLPSGFGHIERAWSRIGKIHKAYSDLANGFPDGLPTYARFLQAVSDASAAPIILTIHGFHDLLCRKEGFDVQHTPNVKALAESLSVAHGLKIEPVTSFAGLLSRIKKGEGKPVKYLALELDYCPPAIRASEIKKRWGPANNFAAFAGKQLYPWGIYGDMRLVQNELYNFHLDKSFAARKNKLHAGFVKELIETLVKIRE